MVNSVYFVTGSLVVMFLAYVKSPSATVYNLSGDINHLNNNNSSSSKNLSQFPSVIIVNCNFSLITIHSIPGWTGKLKSILEKYQQIALPRKLYGSIQEVTRSQAQLGELTISCFCSLDASGEKMQPL